jgi:hypothetical protein
MVRMDEIVRGVRAPSREFCVDAARPKEIRAITGLSLSIFGEPLPSDVGMLRDREQWRREPTRPEQIPSRTNTINSHAMLKGPTG